MHVFWRWLIAKTCVHRGFSVVVWKCFWMGYIKRLLSMGKFVVATRTFLPRFKILTVRLHVHSNNHLDQKLALCLLHDPFGMIGIGFLYWCFMLVWHPFGKLTGRHSLGSKSPLFLVNCHQHDINYWVSNGNSLVFLGSLQPRISRLKSPILHPCIYTHLYTHNTHI